MRAERASVIEAIVTALLREHIGEPAPELVAARVRFVCAQQGRMPDYLRGPFRLLTQLFNVWSLLRHGCTFHRLSTARQQQQLVAWRRSRFAFRRDVVRFYEGLILFDGHSDRHARTSADVEGGARGGAG